MALLYPEATIESIELNKETARVLRTNIKNADIILKGKPHAKINVKNMNSVKYLEKYDKSASFVYFDPPWGGPDYYKKEEVSFIFGRQNVR